MMFGWLRSAALGLLLSGSGFFAGQPAAAQDIQAGYSDLDLAQCTQIATHELGASYACPGYMGFPLYVAEGDLRFFVSYGFNAPDEMAAQQTLLPFNSLGPRIEWRLKQVDGAWVPFASILRWITDDPEGGTNTGEVLVVTKIAPGNTCHIAYIDAKLTQFANEAARQWADSLAPEFNCAKDEIDYVPD